MFLRFNSYALLGPNFARKYAVNCASIDFIVATACESSESLAFAFAWRWAAVES